MAAAKSSSKKTALPQKEVASVVVLPPKMEVIHIPIVGTSPFTSNKFSDKAQRAMLAEMEKTEAEKAKSRKKNRPPKDIEAEAAGSLHVDAKTGDYGIPAMGVKAAMIRACKLVGIEMVTAKMCLEVIPDGFNDNGEPIFHITKGKPHVIRSHVKNANNTSDLRGRSQFSPGWEATITIRYDADFIKAEHVANLVQRAGMQVGIGAGRQFSSNSVGMGWGGFEVKSSKRAPKPVAAE
jgi:hypothetical protein